MFKNGWTYNQIIDHMNKFGSVGKAADAAGMSKSTFQRWLNTAEAQTGRKRFSIPELIEKHLGEARPSIVPLETEDDIPVEEIIDIMTKRFEKRRAHSEEKNLRRASLNSDNPIGLAWLGDPHIDDNGCDWVKLREDLDVIKVTQGMYACSLGDHLNNWVGRLARLYANQDTSQSTAIKLVKWFFDYIDWLIIINGNHDMWLQHGDPIKWLAKPHTINDDWTVNVQLDFPNGRNFRVTASHDFAGHSQWNPLHANMKIARFSGKSHLYVAGHRHNWALAQIELPDRDHVVWLARARGYKTMDEYALVKGYDEQRYGQAIACIINPHAKIETGFVQCFADIHEASDYLTFLRKKYGSKGQ